MAKCLPVLQELVKVVNHIKSRPLNSRLFNAVCQKIEADHQLAYLEDILANLNELNKKLQCRNSNILTSSDKIESFCTKFVLSVSHATNISNEMFPNVMAADSEKVQTLIVKRLELLGEKTNFIFLTVTCNLWTGYEIHSQIAFPLDTYQ